MAPDRAPRRVPGHRHRGREHRPLVIGILLITLAALLASCSARASSAPKAALPARRTSAAVRTRSARPARSPQPAKPVPSTTTTVGPQPGWAVVSTEPSGVAIDEKTITTAGGATVTVLRFRAGQVHFDLHDGSLDPPAGSATLPPDGQPVISPTETPLLLAAFNGGFKVTTDAGGTEVDGQVLTPLVPGLASLVIDAGGGATIGVWGQAGFPPAGMQVASVRQNLPPLVADGQPSPNVGTWTAWGSTITGLTSVARSSLGEDKAGDLLFAASMNCLPIDIADALVTAGAVTAMELDINPYWVQADVAPTPGAALTAAIPGQNRPANQFQVGWTRDFVTVLAGGPGPA